MSLTSAIYKQINRDWNVIVTSRDGAVVALTLFGRGIGTASAAAERFLAFPVSGEDGKHFEVRRHVGDEFANEGEWPQPDGHLSEIVGSVLLLALDENACSIEYRIEREALGAPEVVVSPRPPREVRDVVSLVRIG